MGVRTTYLDDLLKEAAIGTPDACALRWPGGQMSYGELDAKVDALCEALRSEGAGPGLRVGIYMEKSQDSVIAAHAILRAGAAYVPLDPAAPQGRLASVISSCGIELAISEPGKVSHCQSLPLKRVISAAGAVLTGEAGLTERPLAVRSPEDPAYILYTSGTTGVPKGIVHTHISGLAYVRMTSDLCALGPQDKVAHHTPLHFDMSIFDIFSTASVGACTVVLPTMYTKMPASLSKLAEDEKLTVWYSVPYALIQLADRGALEARDLSSIRIVMFAGESIQPGQLKRFADFLPEATYINAYGPAEINGCTAKVLSYAEIDGKTPISIGFPNEGIHTLVLDGDSPADEGELLVGGDQLMQGYWNNPERNAATLTDIDPGDGIVRRYYRSGDIVRKAESGELHLIGRVDRQVKVRGHRVELDEVELAVVSCPGVSEGAVLHRPDDGHLIAYVCPRPGAVLDPAALRADCAKTLPPYAVPTECIPLNDLPRTSTGKIDRMKLAEL